MVPVYEKIVFKYTLHKKEINIKAQQVNSILYKKTNLDEELNSSF